MVFLSTDMGRSRLVSMTAGRAKQRAFEKALSQQIIPGAYQKFVPEVGTLLVVQLPGESLRCPVKKVISEDSVLIEIDSVPMAKSHSFEFEKTYGVRRRVVNGRDVWEAQKDREFLQEQARLVAAEEPVRVKKRLPPEALKPVVAKVAAKKKKFER